MIHIGAGLGKQVQYDPLIAQCSSWLTGVGAGRLRGHFNVFRTCSVTACIATRCVRSLWAATVTLGSHSDAGQPQ